MSKELMVAKSDLEQAGISTQITTSDLIDVVADDIFKKTMSNLRSYQDESKELYGRYEKLFNTPLKAMKDFLIKNGMIGQNDVTHDNWNLKRDGGSCYASIYTVSIEERANGLKVDTTKRENGFYYPKKGQTEIEVVFTIEVGEKESEEVFNKGGIRGTKTTTTSSLFTKTQKLSSKPLFDLVADINAYDKRLREMAKTLPEGLISVEKFAREARVKLTKKMLSGQPKDFKEKMYQLFNIKL